MQQRVLALDFDGVFCDSRPECLVTGLLAYAETRPNAGPFPRDVERLDRDLVRRFMRHRHLVRVAAQFMQLLDLLLSGRAVDDSLSLDVQLPADPRRLADYKRAFYGQRGRWMEEDPESWLTHNPVFGPVIDVARAWLSRDALALVSAKDCASILSILGRHGLELPPGLVLDNAQGDKPELMRRLVSERPGREVVFVDDNLENLLSTRMPGVVPVLARWGFVSPHTLAEAGDRGIQVLELETFVERFA